MPEAETRACQNCKSQFTVEPEDLDFYKKIDVPPPTACFRCRFPQLIIWRNERALYKRICDLCEKEIISMYKPETPFPVYCHDCWWSDSWDPLKFGKQYDFSKPFFEQMAELQNKVPRQALYEAENVNSEYCNFTSHNKNCYLMFGSWFSEDCGYGQTVLESRNCWDCLFIKNCEGCMHSIDCTKCYETHFSQNCEGCTSSAFLYDCRNCQNCLFSWNLRSKNYYVFNKPVSREEFNRIKAETFSSYSNLQKRLAEFRGLIQKEAVHKYMTGERNLNSSGDFIYNSKNVRSSFFIHDGENEKYAVRGGKGQKDSMDVFGVHAGELAYQSMNMDFCSRVSFCVNGENDVAGEYLIDCFATEHSFGSISLHHKKYCILNTQYDEAAYNDLRKKIISHMSRQPYRDKKGAVYAYGDFFPMEIAPFGYNETLAQEYAPITKEQAGKMDYPWYDIPEKGYETTKRYDEMPESVAEADESILKENILCEAWDQDKEIAKEHKCTKAFRLTADELKVYKKFSLPLPRKCPNTRNFEKFKMRNPVNFWARECMCAADKSQGGRVNTTRHFHDMDHCPNKFQTAYAPDRPEIVYCEQCYQAEVA